MSGCLISLCSSRPGGGDNNPNLELFTQAERQDVKALLRITAVICPNSLVWLTRFKALNNSSLIAFDWPYWQN